MMNQHTCSSARNDKKFEFYFLLQHICSFYNEVDSYAVLGFRICYPSTLIDDIQEGATSCLKAFERWDRSTRTKADHQCPHSPDLLSTDTDTHQLPELTYRMSCPSRWRWTSSYGTTVSMVPSRTRFCTRTLPSRSPGQSGLPDVRLWCADVMENVLNIHIPLQLYSIHRSRETRLWQIIASTTNQSLQQIKLLFQERKNKD